MPLVIGRPQRWSGSAAELDEGNLRYSFGVCNITIFEAVTIEYHHVPVLDFLFCLQLTKLAFSTGATTYTIDFPEGDPELQIRRIVANGEIQLDVADGGPSVRVDESSWWDAVSRVARQTISVIEEDNPTILNCTAYVRLRSELDDLL